jgi:hypothetical protein
MPPKPTQAGHSSPVECPSFEISSAGRQTRVREGWAQAMGAQWPAHRRGYVGRFALITQSENAVRRALKTPCARYKKRAAAHDAATRSTSAPCTWHLMPLGILVRPGQSRLVGWARCRGCVRAGPQHLGACLYRPTLSTCLTPYSTQGGTSGMYVTVRMRQPPILVLPLETVLMSDRSVLLQ